MKHMDAKKTAEGFTGAEVYKKGNLMYEKCDIFVPAAGEKLVKKKDAENIQAKVFQSGCWNGRPGIFLDQGKPGNDRDFIF